MQIADGTKTAADVAAATTERSQRHRALSPLRNGENANEPTRKQRAGKTAANPADVDTACDHDLAERLRHAEITNAALEHEVEELKAANAKLKAENAELRAKLEAAGASQQRPSTNGKGKEENGAGGNDALASAGKRKAAYVLEAASDPGPIPECLRRSP